MALFGRDYDRTYQDRGGVTPRGWGYRYDLGYRGADRGGIWGAYDREFGNRGAYDQQFGNRGGYDQQFGNRGGYDRNYKSRWQTDYGDPFGDRAAHTPMRVVHGGYRGPHGMRDRGMEYGLDYDAGPMGYRSRFGQGGSWNRDDRMRGYDTGYRARGRDYNWWF